MLGMPCLIVSEYCWGVFHWNDRQGLEQALLIAEAYPVDMDELARWSGVEGMLDKFDSIKAKFQKAQK
jgi:hypothetical protein